MSRTTLETAGFIGLGAMGYPMASHLAKQGLLTAVHNRSHARSSLFVEEHPGVSLVGSPEEILDRVDVVFLCVPQDSDVLGIVEKFSGGISEGQMVIDCSTINPETTVTVAKLLQEQKGAFLDAPVSGGVEGAKSGRLSIMVGGGESDVNRAKPFLETFSGQILHMGPVGSGQSAKAVNQVMCAGINQAVTEALAFANRLGLDLEKTIEAIRGGAAGNWFLEKRGHSMTQGNFKPGFKVRLHQKDLGICLALASAAGIEIPLTRLTLEHYDLLISEGHGDEDISALYRLKGRTS